jgi:hypothetical protein
VSCTVSVVDQGEPDTSGGAFGNTAAAALIGIATGEFPATGPACPTNVVIDGTLQSKVFNCAGDLVSGTWSCFNETGSHATVTIEGDNCGGTPLSDSDNAGGSVSIFAASGGASYSYVCSGFGSVSGSVPVEAIGSVLKHSPSVYADLRTQEMIDGGCGFPSNCLDPSGATVTVTDLAGVSVTQVF